MAKTKQLTTEELLKAVLELSFDNKVYVLNELKIQVQAEATTKKEEGLKAEQILKSINNSK